MTFEGITLKTYKSLVSFFNDKDHSINSIGKIIKNWKVFIKAARKRELHENLIDQHEDFITPEEETDAVALDEAELATIFKHNYPNPTLDLVRDWGIIDAYTGLRISDVQLLSDNNLIRDTIIIANEKTDTKVAIPLHPYVKAIVKKYNGFPRKISDQKMNEYIKQVCELAGIKEKVLYSLTKGGVRRDEYLPKWQLVTNHTFRRSFITNLLNAGIPDNQVMQLAGIIKHATLMRYKKTKPEETAKLLKGHKFFGG